MPKDLFTLKKTISVYDDLLREAKVNKIIQPTKDSIVLTLYNKKAFNVIISTNAKYARLSLTNSNYVSPLTAPNFCMLLRKYLLGATVKLTEIAFGDRIISITLSNLNDFKEFKEYKLYIELMGKYSNVFLTADGVILGSLKSMPHNLENARLCLVGAKYVCPPKQNKVSVFDSEKRLIILSNATYPITDKFLFENFLDFAPVTAKELSFYINSVLSDSSTAKDYDTAVLDFISKPLAPIVLRSKEYSDVLIFDYIHLKGEKQSYSSFLKAEEAFYSNYENNDKISQFKNSLIQKVLAFKKKEEKKCLILKDRLKKCENYDKNKLYGELITANIYKVKKGDNFVEVINYYDENSSVIKIPLDVNLYPQENAQRYYKKYSKEKKTIEVSRVQLEKTISEIKYAENLIYDIENSLNALELKEIEKELISQNFIKEQEDKAKQKSKKLEPINYLTYVIDGFTIKVGKNNLQNEALLQEASKNDLWLHVKDYHSSFVIIKTEGKTPPDSVILAGAEICAYYSQGKNGSKISVDCTQRKFVKKQPASRPGSVFYTDYQTFVVNPNSHL